MTSKIVRSLVDDGLVLRRDDPADSRALHVTLTAAGRSKAAQGCRGHPRHLRRRWNAAQTARTWLVSAAFVLQLAG